MIVFIVHSKGFAIFNADQDGGDFNTVASTIVFHGQITCVLWDVVHNYGEFGTHLLCIFYFLDEVAGASADQ